MVVVRKEDKRMEREEKQLRGNKGDAERKHSGLCLQG